MRDIETIDSELRLVAALRRATREHGGPLPSIHAADALLDERRELTALGNNPQREFSQFPTEYLMGARGAAWSVSSS